MHINLGEANGIAVLFTLFLAALLNVEQAAERLGLKVATMRSWILRRKISYAKVGGKSVRIPEEEIQRIIDEGMVPAMRQKS